MNWHFKYWPFVTIVLIAAAALALLGADSTSSLSLTTFDSPIATPATPVPTPAPPMPGETQRVLDYIAEREGVPAAQLLVVNQHRRTYELLGRTFWAVTVLDVRNDRWHDVMVDLADGSFVEDLETMDQAERLAHRARYGKLEPALFERLETMKDDDKVQVAIWIAGVPRQSERELYESLAAKYPEAQEALERSGNPFDVGDYKRINELEAEYVRMLEADTQDQIQPVVRYLEKQGHVVTTFGGLPTVAATLTKAQILEVASRDDVGIIYLAGEKETLELDSAVPSDRVPAAWSRGIRGSGIDVAILEGSRVDFTGPVGHNYLNQGQVRQCQQAETRHKTMVASVAASYHNDYPGVALEATIHDACTNGSDVDTVAALSWVITRADPINYSAGFFADNQMHWIDAAFDYWARHGLDTIVKSSGNSGGPISSPGKGWNIITVGATNHKENAAWSDDEWRSSSGWNNPSGGYREKPEVVAPGESITAVELDNNTWTDNGTSLSAPQVAGLAALMMDRNPDLAVWPGAVKAIIMASALNNVDGPSGIPSGQDLKDGAGAIDAALADMTAKTRGTSTSACVAPCWWGESIDNTNFPVGTYLFRKFKASRGECVRIAISWWSFADCPDQAHCFADILLTNLDLVIWDPDWLPVDGAYSASWDNNYELVEFIAPKTGEYKIGVHKASSSETQTNQLGLAWIKDATYLPDLRNKDGWVSEIIVRNDGAQPRNVQVNYFRTNGTSTPKGSDTCYLNSNQQCTINVSQYNRIPADTTGSAIVDGGEDVSVVVMNMHQGTPYATGSYTGLSQAASTLYLPLLQRANNNMYSDFTLFNVGAAQATVQVQYIPENGNYSGCTASNITIPTNGSRNFNSRDGTLGCTTSSPFVGGARVTSSQLLVAVANNWRDYGANGSLESFMSYEAFPTGYVPNYLPLLQRNNDGANSQWYTSITFQDTATSAQPVNLHYFREDTSAECGSALAYFTNGLARVFPSPPDGVCGAWNEKFVGAARVTRAGYRSAAVVLQENFKTGKQEQKMSYSATGGGTATVVMPWVMNDYGPWQGRSHWWTGLNVQNASGNTASVTVNYYDANGSWRATSQPVNIPPKSLHVFFPTEIGSNRACSAVVTANRYIAVVANHFSLQDYPNDTVDTYMSHTGLNH